MSFRGAVTVMGPNPNAKWVFGGGVMACLLFGAALVVLPGSLKLIVAAVIGAMMVAIYPRALSGVLKPLRQTVSLYVDHSGIYADGTPFALRREIAQAYIRPALQARTSRHQNYGSAGPSSFRLDLPAYPLTVELVTRTGQLNIDPAGQDAAAAILIALGFPVTMCAPDHVARTSHRQIVWSVVIVVVVLVAVSGYSVYMSHHFGGSH